MVQELIGQRLSPDELVTQAAIALTGPEITRTQAGKAVGDILAHLGDIVPHGAQALLQEVIGNKPKGGSSQNWQEAPW